MKNLDVGSVNRSKNSKPTGKNNNSHAKKKKNEKMGKARRQKKTMVEKKTCLVLLLNKKTEKKGAIETPLLFPCSLLETVQSRIWPTVRSMRPRCGELEKRLTIGAWLEVSGSRVSKFMGRVGSWTQLPTVQMVDAADADGSLFPYSLSFSALGIWYQNSLRLVFDVWLFGSLILHEGR
ncbi:hypothetical protein SDJN03_22510, partial [Cucurbita argyrosperma subsp. sororia]